MSPDDARLVADHLAILEVLARYARGVDTRRWAAVRACFTDDAVVEGTRAQGPVDDYLATMRVTLAPFVVTSHLITNPIVELQGDTASVESTCLALHWRSVDSERGAVDDMSMQVSFDDNFARGDDGWRIRRRTVTAAWTTQFVPPIS